MTRENQEKVGFYVDEELFDRMEERRKLEDKSRTEYLTDLIKQDLEHTSAEEYEKQAQLHKQKAQKLKKKAEQHQQKARKFQSKLETFKTREEDYRDEIEELAKDASINPSLLDPSSKRVRRIGKIVGKNERDVIDDTLNALAVDSIEDLEAFESDGDADPFADVDFDAAEDGEQDGQEVEVVDGGEV